MSTRHVLLISRSFPHHRAGGMEWHVQDVAEGLMERGWKVSVLTTPLPAEPALRRLGVNGEILQVGARSGRYDAAFFRSFWGATAQAVRRLRPDLVHAQGFAGMAAWQTLRRQMPVLTTIHGTLWSETPLRRDGHARPGDWWRYKHRLAVAPLWRWFLRSRAPLITDSRFTVRELRREAGIRPNVVAVVPLGFDLTRFPMGDRMALREEWGVSPFDILAVAIGRLEQIKAPDQVLKAFLRSAPENPRLRLVIAGEGPMVPVLKEMLAGAPELAERVRLPGRLPGEQLPGLLQAADVFLNPDMGAPAFGLANAEALCMGAPVITTAVGAHREVVRGEEDGLLMEPYHTVRNALTRLLPHLPESEESRQSRADRARRRFRRGRMITRLESVYRTLLES